jgi:hypothetical protein
MKNTRSSTRDFEATQGGKSMNSGNGITERIMQVHRCADCPIRCQAKAKPRSLYARIHRWHSTWWPGWKIYQAELRDPGAKATSRP